MIVEQSTHTLTTATHNALLALLQDRTGSVSSSRRELLEKVALTQHEADIVLGICHSTEGRLPSLLNAIAGGTSLFELQTRFAVVDAMLDVNFRDRLPGFSGKQFVQLTHFFTDLECDPEDPEDVCRVLNYIADCFDSSGYQSRTQMHGFVQRMIGIAESNGGQMSLEEALHLYLLSKSSFAATDSSMRQTANFSDDDPPDNWEQH
jgi:hypothetical protein